MTNHNPDMSTLPKIVAIDFDGTLCDDKYPEIGVANIPMIDYCKSLKADGVRLILWTCRTEGYLDAAIEFCREYRLEFDAINDNIQEVKDLFNDNCRKVYADKYIDDKNGLVLR